MHATIKDGPAPVTATELVAILDGDATHARAVYARSLPFLKNLVRRHAPSLPSDLRLEVVQETWHLILARHDVLLLNKGDVTPSAYMAMVARNAIEVVRAKHRPAGSRSRESDSLAHEKVASFDFEVGDAESHRRFELEERARQIRIDIERLMASAEPPVKAAVSLMFNEGMTITDAAAKVGMSRQTLGRRLQALRSAA